MRALLHRLPKPLLFALLGGLGCVLGALPGEWLLTALRPPVSPVGTNAPVAAPLVVARVTAPPEPQTFTPQPAAPVLVFSNELQKRLQREEAKTGDVQISLMWDSLNDLDLHCVGPDGERIYHNHRRSKSGGELDVDMNARYTGRSEVIFVLDCSGSMMGRRMEETKLAAADLAQRLPPGMPLAVIGFDTTATNRLAMTNEARQVVRFIQSLLPRGGTRMDLGLKAAQEEFERVGKRRGAADTNSPPLRSVLLFTDGQPNQGTEEATVTAASQLRWVGVRVIAVGTGDAKLDFLTSLTESKNQVFIATDGSLARAFAAAENLLKSPDWNRSQPAARPPFSGKPVENIYWPTNGAPEGTYQVFVNHYSLHSPANETPYTVAIKQGGKAQEFRGTIRHGQTNTVHTFQVKKAPPPDLAKLNQRQPPSPKVTLVIGLWTSLLAVGMAALIVATQNFLLRRALFNMKEAALVLGGGVLAGLISGAVSQHLFALGANSVAAQITETEAERVLPLIIKAGQLVGWSLLGALLGFGLAFFIPNLPRFRAGFAGLVGGGLGALAFLVALAQSGEVAGRLVGAAILGLTIGLVVALVERLAREAALIVHWHENERTVINLGAKPVILGSSSEAHLYLPKHKGFPPVTAIVTFRDGRVQMENKLSNSTHTLASGNKLQIGELWIEIQTDAK